ncbi:MAG: PHP domain-containing protein [Gracilibacteraceae bacterium]|nr:PHP domain-containing protein [Gracilibacteraceae bacterium]
MKADLHIHSTASDGSLTAERILAESRARGLEVVALTDHETTAGAAAALLKADEYGLRVIPAVELSTHYKGEEIHLLGYYPRGAEHPRLLARLAAARRHKTEMTEWMVGRLAAAGFPLDWPTVAQTAEGETVCKTHIYYAMQRYWPEATKQDWLRVGDSLRKGGRAYSLYEEYGFAEAVELVRETGGLPVLAHPGLIANQALTPELLRCPVGGIEAYYGYWRDGAALVRAFARMGRERSLLRTGGSDYHSSFSHFPIGGVTVPGEAISKLLEFLEDL